MTGSRTSRWALGCAATVALAALAWASFAKPWPRLVYNPSVSVPVGWYLVDPWPEGARAKPSALQVGSIVLVRLPANASALAAQRSYLPLNVPLLKRVGALPPQQVCVFGEVLHVDGLPVATVLAADRLGRPLPRWQPCRRLATGEVLLLSVTHPASFDSRYFGPVHNADVIGVAQPLWLRERP